MARKGLRVEVCQSKHGRSDLEGNLSRILDAVKSSSSDLLVFPEMFLTGYTLGDEVFDLAQSLDSPSISRIEDALKGTGKHVVFGFPERSKEVLGQVHNSACVIGPDGFVGAYRKMHLVDFGPFEEWAYFTPGRSPFMFEANGWKIGLLICYDLFFPELTKYYALMGADAVICISASPSMTRTFFEDVMKARAIEDTIYFIYSNLIGFDARMDFWGGGAVIGPRGEPLVKGPYYEEAMVQWTLDPDALALARRNRPTIRDTRPALLRELARWGDMGGPFP